MHIVGVLDESVNTLMTENSHEMPRYLRSDVVAEVGKGHEKDEPLAGEEVEEAQDSLRDELRQHDGVYPLCRVVRVDVVGLQVRQAY